MTSEAWEVNESDQTENLPVRIDRAIDKLAAFETANGEGRGAVSTSMNAASDPASIRTLQLKKAISRWENEGGADADEVARESESSTDRSHVELTNAELVQMQIRIIALENLVTALFAGAPEAVATLARELADCISPRAGHTAHHLTVHAASHMLHLIRRSEIDSVHLKRRV